MQDFGVCGSEGGLAKLKIGKFWQIFDKMKVCVVGSQPPPTSHLQPVVNFSQRHSLTNHFIDLLVSELLAEVGHHVTKLSCTNKTVAVFVKNPEGLPDFFFTVCVFHLSSHHGEELGEVNGSISIGINLVDHV